MRKLASIQRILEIRPIEGADNIVVAKVLGWEVVTQKSNNFQVGDLVVFYEPDAVLPPKPEYAFLERYNYRIRTIKLRGQLSQGLILPLKEVLGPLNEIPFAYEEGDDLTELLGVKKWEFPISPEMEGQIEGAFPSWIPKTDENRIQSDLWLLDEIWGLPYYVTQKDDGTSATYAIDDTGKFIVCSRNLSLKKTNNLYWQMAEKYEIEKHLNELSSLSVFQGEIVGPGIQQNHLGLSEPELHLFTVISPKIPGGFLEYEGIWPHANNLQFVKILEIGSSFHYTLEELLQLAEGKYDSGKDREGIVIRPKVPLYSKRLHGNLSFKVLNNQALLKEK